MCVIIEAPEVFPTKAMLEQAWEKNPDGAGIAWVDQGQVFWRKNLSVKDVIGIGKSVPGPWVIHFRKASQGGKLPELTHPFPVQDDVSLATEGSASKVLFHNGTISDYEQHMFMAMQKFNGVVPPGDWSDTRVMAFLVNLYGDDILRFVTTAAKSSQKFAIMSVVNGQANIQRFPRNGEGWNKIDTFHLSNDIGTATKFTASVTTGSSSSAKLGTEEDWQHVGGTWYYTRTPADLSAIPC